ACSWHQSGRVRGASLSFGEPRSEVAHAWPVRVIGVCPSPHDTLRIVAAESLACLRALNAELGANAAVRGPQQSARFEGFGLLGRSRARLGWLRLWRRWLRGRRGRRRTDNARYPALLRIGSKRVPGEESAKPLLPSIKWRCGFILPRPALVASDAL